MNNRVTDILAEKMEHMEKIVSVEMNDLIHNALEDAKNINASKIAVKQTLDITRSNRFWKFWVISPWKLRLLDQNISFKKVYDEKTEIFEQVKVISKDVLADYEETLKIVSGLDKTSGIIVVEGDKIMGFVSLSNFSDSELKLLKTPPLTYDQIREKSKVFGGLVGALLHGINIEGIDLRHGDLRGADLNNANLTGANLVGADLTGVNLSGANLTNAKLRQAKLNGAILKDAILINADLRNAELWNADAEKARFQRANLQDSELYRANLKFANLEDTNLLNSGLMGANLEETNLNRADIRNANLKDAIFNENTNLNDITLNSVTIDNLTESALKANWDPDINRILIEKFSQKRESSGFSREN